MTGTIYEFNDLPGPDAAMPGGKARRRGSRDQPGRPVIGIVYNPRSHRNRGQDLALGGLDNVMVETPETRGQIVDALEGFAAAGIDYLIINGGDGTVRDVLTCGSAVFGEDWPELAVLPKGKTNALNVDLGAPANWSLNDAIDAYANGRRVNRRPLEVSGLASESAPVRGFILGAGAFTLGIKAGQDAHRLGFFDSLAVGATTAWGLLQSFFGGSGNKWRRGVPMSVHLLPEGRELPHSSHGDPARRWVLLASTLEQFPMGVQPFGALTDGLKLAVLDRPRRRVLASLPLLLTNWWQPKKLAQSGLHRLSAEAFEFRIDDQFILDGEAFPAGKYLIAQGPELTFVTA